ncbi:GrpB family protein [Paenibacillus sp. MBLB4367]|uniref:GrpB family protein n=1 Tax=Paenibacillus sp. MBLB4367 TaxID=3384767 RepID=UPI0039084114
MEEVVVTGHNPEWENEYEREKGKIADALNDILAGIEHIGSTSVPGLAAKPVIDMMAGVLELSDLTEKHVDALRSLGYTHVDHSHFPERKFFRRGEWRAGTHHLHVYRINGTHWRSNLLFRNYLRSHPAAMQEYHELKVTLISKHKQDRAAYTEAKAPFIQSIIQLAMSEAEEAPSNAICPPRIGGANG